MVRSIYRKIILCAALIAGSCPAAADEMRYTVEVEHALWAGLAKVWRCSDGSGAGISKTNLAELARRVQIEGDSALLQRKCDTYNVTPPSHIYVEKPVIDGLLARNGLRWYAAELTDVTPGAMGYTFWSIFSLSPAALATPVRDPLPQTSEANEANEAFEELVTQISPEEQFYICPNREVIQRILKSTKILQTDRRDAAINRMAGKECALIDAGGADVVGAWGMIDVSDGIWFAVSAARDGEPVEILIGWAS